MSTENPTPTPDTIVLIHGLWMTPRSWEHWVPYYTAKGYNVITPAYPGFEVEVESLNADTTPITSVSIRDVIDHLISVIKAVDTPPILIGHSAGGLFTQIMLDRGLGAVGVAIDSAPPEGILVTPATQLKSLFPLLANPLHRHHALGFTHDQFHYAFTNTLSIEDSKAAYERYAIAAPGDFVWTSVLANFTPGHQDTYVNFENDDRAPLLLIAGGADNIMPPSVNKSNANHYHKSKAITEFHEFPGRSHFTCGEAGWEAVADFALDWAVKHAVVKA